jgi:hypothetical protein
MMKSMFLLQDSPFADPILLLVAVIGPALEQLAKTNRKDRTINEIFMFALFRT